MKSSMLSLIRCGGLLAFSVCAASAQAQPTDISSTVNLEADASFEVREETYTLPEAKIKSPADELPPEFALRPEMVGVVVSPVNATGPRPVAVFVHGQASTCADPTTDEPRGGWPCAEGLVPVPSYRGFLANQRYLAARGWVTVSISANGIGASVVTQGAPTDTLLRAELVQQHLRQWAQWIAGDKALPPPAFITAGVAPDLKQLMVIGHPRGGSAANQVALLSATDPSLPWRVRAQVLIGPVSAHFNPAPTVPTVVLLPGCDGDVTDLQGQSFIDRARDLIADSALRSAVFIDGANHTFFNSEWDPTTASVRAAGKDDTAELFGGQAPQGACRAGARERLRGEVQRELGSFYIAAAGKALVQGDTNVLPLLDGSPVCAGPTCRAKIQTHALGGRRQPLLIPELEAELAVSEEISVVPCLTERHAGDDAACISADMPLIKTLPRTPHFMPVIEAAIAPVTLQPSHVALRVEWSAVGQSARLGTSHAALSGGASHVTARVIVDPNAVDSTFALDLLDAAGVVLPLGTARLSGVPAKAEAGTGVYWAQEVRFPIDMAAAAAAGFDTSAAAAIQITSQSAKGLLWVLDAWSYAPGAAPAAGSAARFELTSDTVVPDGTSQVRVPARVIGQLAEPAEIYYYVGGIERTFTVAPGTQSFDITLPAPAVPEAGLTVYFVGSKGMVQTSLVETLKYPQ